MIKKEVIPLNLQYFAETAGTDAVDTAAGDTTQQTTALSDNEELSTLLDSMGGSGEEDNTNTQQQTEVQPDAQQEQQKPPTPEDKSNYAFGQMRKQVSELTDLLGKIAKANGVEYTNTQDLVTKLKDNAIETLAKTQNIPVELLKEVEELRNDSNAWKEQQLRDSAAVGFQTVMSQYGLTQEQLQEFAIELDKDGKNPFAQKVDLVAEYKVRHFDDIMAAKVDAAVKAALAKDTQSTQTSTTPIAQTTPGGAEPPKKITTIDGLNDLLNQMPN